MKEDILLKKCIIFFTWYLLWEGVNWIFRKKIIGVSATIICEKSRSFRNGLPKVFLSKGQKRSTMHLIRVKISFFVRAHRFVLNKLYNFLLRCTRLKVKQINGKVQIWFITSLNGTTRRMKYGLQKLLCDKTTNPESFHRNTWNKISSYYTQR